MDEIAPSSPTQKWIGFGIAILLLLAFYGWTAHPTIGPLYNKLYLPPGAPADYYNALARAFLAGKTSLFIEPRPELLALDDPYDPIKNHQRDAQGFYALHDASLYKGKYYVYFGVTPAVMVFTPFLFVTGEYLPPSVAATLLALGGLVFTALLLNLLADRFFPSLGNGARFALIITLGCCNCVPYLLRSPMFYEIAILSAYCFLVGGLYFLARGSLGNSFRPGSVACGSLSLGLAVGSRPHMALVALIVFAIAAVWLVVRFRRNTLSTREFMGRAVAFVAPWLFCVGLLAAYNYQRFDSPTEFGARYALVGGDVRIKDRQMLDFHRLRTDLYCYLLFPPHMQSRFPYVSLTLPVFTQEDSNKFFGFTPIGGLLVCMPFLGFLLLSPLTLYRSWKSRRYELLAAMIVLLSSGISILLCVSCFSAAMRYTVDFANLLVISSLLVFLDLERASRNWTLLKWFLRLAAVASLAVSCLFNLGISIIGQRSNPRDLLVCDRLQEVCPRIPLFSRTMTAQLQIQFPPNKKPDECEPLIVSGNSYEGDFLFVHYRGNNRVSIAFNHWGSASIEGVIIQLVPGHSYVLEAEWDSSDGTMICRMDGEEVIFVNSDVYYLDPLRVQVGMNSIGGGLFTSEVFTGEIQSQTLRFHTARTRVFGQ